MAPHAHLTHEEAAELLGAFALDACEADEAVAVEAHVATCDECAAEASSLREVAAVLGSAETAPPPDHLEAAILSAALVARDPALVAYREAAATLEYVVDELPPEAWRTPIAGDWTPQDLLAHLAAIDSLLATTIGLEPVTAETNADFLGRTEEAIARNRQQAPDATVAEWRAVSRALIGFTCDAPPEAMDAPLDWFGMQLPVRQVLVTRAFETWIHTDDSRLAAHRPLESPTPASLAAMSDVAVHLLPRALEADNAIARVVLTGPGGGTWDLVLGDADLGGPPDVVVTADTASFCRLAGGRLTPDALAVDVQGDEQLAGRLVAAAAALAMP
jgi:uncharacterized protein (TIGR03083 family)